VKNKVLLIVIAVIVIISGGFFVWQQKSALPQDEISQLREPADLMTENILSAINEEDYNKFSENFNAEMKNSISESLFSQNNAVIKAAVGHYLLSKELTKEAKEGQYFSFYYKADFSDEPEGVAVKLVLKN